ncbi:hypothetical protein OTU49_001407 [Cherax quadricarinatus]|uniref:Uncharacterized protein n=1 Tax=Cherax quadricarinatus TaxID=27406 RepID=A0AAW0XK57_CHEQU
MSFVFSSIHSHMVQGGPVEWGVGEHEEGWDWRQHMFEGVPGGPLSAHPPRHVAEAPCHPPPPPPFPPSLYILLLDHYHYQWLGFLIVTFLNPWELHMAPCLSVDTAT